MRCESHREPGYIDTVDFSVFEMMGQRGIAGPSIRIHTDPAGTEDFTITDFEEAAFEFVRHRASPFEKRLQLNGCACSLIERFTPRVSKQSSMSSPSRFVTP